MCWHVRKRVLFAEPIKVAPQVQDLSFITKGQVFFVCGARAAAIARTLKAKQAFSSAKFVPANQKPR